MLHLETDLYKQYLTFYTDQNFFSDRTNGWIVLSEWDGTYALTGLVDRFGWRIQYERDAPIDKSGLKRSLCGYLAHGSISGDRRFELVESTLSSSEPDGLCRCRLAVSEPAATLPGQIIPEEPLPVCGPCGSRPLQEQSRVVRRCESLYRPGVWKLAKPPASWIGLSGWRCGFAEDTELSVYREQDQPLDKARARSKYAAVQLRYSFDVPKRLCEVMSCKVSIYGSHHAVVRSRTELSEGW